MKMQYPHPRFTILFSHIERDLAKWWEMAVVFAEKSVIILLFFLKGNPI